MSKLNSVTSLSNKVLMVLWFVIFANPITHAFFWFSGTLYPSENIIFEIDDPSNSLTLALDTGTSWAGYLTSNITILVTTLITWQLIKLFRLYSQGCIFTERNTQQYRKVANLLVFYVLSRFVEGLLLSWVFSTGNDDFYVSVIIEDIDIALLLTSLMINIIAKVMHEAKELQEEQSMTI